MHPPMYLQPSNHPPRHTPSSHIYPSQTQYPLSRTHYQQHDHHDHHEQPEQHEQHEQPHHNPNLPRQHRQPHPHLQRVSSAPTLFHSNPYLNNTATLCRPTPSYCSSSSSTSNTMPSPLSFSPVRKVYVPVSPVTNSSPEELWPVDDTPNYSVAALPNRKNGTRFSRRSLDNARMRRLASHHCITQPRISVRRSITAVEDEYQRASNCAQPTGIILQGYCKMKLFAGIRCTRFLRLAKRQLECFDGALRRRLWNVCVDGARVRILMNGHKIVLSKLQAGFVVEFYVADEHNCKEWAAALLRASMLVRHREPKYDPDLYY